MAVMKSFELNGNKQSFANWISNLSPCDTPFTSMIGKDRITQSQYSWQFDTLAPADNAAYEEGSDVVPRKPESTFVITNFTSILRKVVQVSDTAEVLGTHGRNSEIAYQMKKAGKEIMRDLELMNLTNEDAQPGNSTEPSRHYGFIGLCAGAGVPDGDTGAVTHKEVEVMNYKGNWFTSNDIFDLTYNLYIANSKANTIMFHPRHALTFSSFINANVDSDKVFRMFDGMDSVVNTQVKRIKDPLGRIYTLVPNRYMPEDLIYFFNPEDWTQTILRSPATSKLSKSGSSERFLMEMEVGLRHRHLFASGIIKLVPGPIQIEIEEIKNDLTIGVKSNIRIKATQGGNPIPGEQVTWKASNPSIVSFEQTSATTDNNGKASAVMNPKEEGLAVLTIGVGNKQITATVNVKNMTIAIQLTPSSIDQDGTAEATATLRSGTGELLPEGIVVTWTATPANLVDLGGESVTDDLSTALQTFTALGVAGLAEIKATVGAVSSNKLALTIN